MNLNKDQISEATKSNLEATKSNLESQVSLYIDFTGKALESIEKLITLNLTATRASLDEAAASARQMLTAKDPQEFISLIAAQARPNLNKAVAYGGHLTNIAVTAQTQFSKFAEAQLAGFGQRVSGLVEEASRNAPAGSENMAALIKTAFDKASSGYEQFSRTSKQATEAAFTAVAAPVVGTHTVPAKE